MAFSVDLSGDNPFTVAAAATHGSVVGTQTNVWQAVLASLIGTYGLVRQYQILQDQLNLAERSVTQADDYLALADSAYNNISVPTFTRQAQQFDRYTSTFGGYEDIYMADAFRLQEYTPQYDVQMGRTLASVQAQFDKAALQRKRMTGKYNTGRACHDATWFATMTALAKVDAVNHGYRYEDSKKITLDGWYWDRRTAGARINEAHASRIVSGINGGASVVGDGLNSIGNSIGRVQGAVAQASQAFGEQSNFFGSLANSAFRGAGFIERMGGPGYGGGSMMGGMYSGVSSSGVAPTPMGMLGGGVPSGSNWGNWTPGPTSSSAGIGSHHSFW